MKQNEAMVVLHSIAELYPRFHLTRRKQQFLIPILIKMEYQGVMRNLADYVENHPYPPTIAEIAAFPPETNSHLEHLKKWQEEARNVPDEVKQRFKEKFAMLLKERTNP